MGVTAGAALDRRALERVVEQALGEDLGTEEPGTSPGLAGDVTTNALLGPATRAQARLVVKETGVVCGLPVAEAVFRALDRDVDYEPLVAEGESVEAGVTVARVEGSGRAILTAERTALNLLGRLSGVATLARAFVEEAAETGVVVLDTRKTTPGLRALEKYATRVGGATNHRFGLYDGVLVKDNHLRLAGGVAAAVAMLRQAGTGHPIEVEVETLDEVRQALAAGADVLLLDNMATGLMARAVGMARGRARTEASGGVTLSRVRAVAQTGVDSVSVGAITHGARSLDVSMEVL